MSRRVETFGQSKQLRYYRKEEASRRLKFRLETHHCISHTLLAELLVVVKVIFVAVGFE